MKTMIHPEYKETTYTCMSCSTQHHIPSTTGGNVSVEICSNCHPFYTGQQRVVDTAGRVGRFYERYGRAA